MDDTPNAEVESAVPSAEVAAPDPAPSSDVPVVAPVVAPEATEPQTEAVPPPAPAESETAVVLVFRGTFDKARRPLTYVSGLPAHDLTRAQVRAYIGSAATLAAVLETKLFVVADGATLTWPDPAPAPE